MRSSNAAADLIIAEEVTSPAVYQKKYRRPEWPGASSGATVAVGYDLGMTPRTTILSDWEGRVPPPMLKAMLEAAGKTGASGRAAAHAIRSRVDIPWETAIAVHKECVIPRWEATLLRVLPKSRELPADCFGVLLSLIFNRGPDFTSQKDSRREMRAIKAHVNSGEWEKIPAEIRRMKRLWDKKKLPGLHKRRDKEAALFEKGLRSQAASFAEVGVDDDVDAEFKGGADHLEGDPVTDLSSSNVSTDPVGEYASAERIRKVQADLATMKYWPGGIDGDWGGRLRGAIAAFDLDRGRASHTPTIDAELVADIDKAMAEGFTRPIAKAREGATVAELKPKNETVLVSWRNKVTAWALGIGSTVVGIYKAALEFLGDAWDYLETPRMILGSVPGWVWAGSALGIAVFIGWNSQRAEKDTVEKFRDGRLAE